MGCNSAVDDAQRFVHQFWAAGEQESQLERKTQYPLADGFMRQDFIYQQGSTLSHASGTATGTETPSFTAELNQPFIAATQGGNKKKAWRLKSLGLIFTT
jgi:hypothetical protein